MRDSNPFKQGDRVTLIEDYGAFKKGDTATVLRSSGDLVQTRDLTCFAHRLRHADEPTRTLKVPDAILYLQAAAALAGESSYGGVSQVISIAEFLRDADDSGAVADYLRATVTED